MEQQHLRPLPPWVPEVYRLHERMVDVEGYVTVNTNRYSVTIAQLHSEARAHQGARPFSELAR
jgi:hypothetical protein